MRFTPKLPYHFNNLLRRSQLDKYSRKIPLVAFCFYFAKMLNNSSTLVDAGILLVLAAAAFAWEFKSNNKQLQDLETKINTLHEEVEKNKSQMNSIKISTMRLGR